MEHPEYDAQIGQMLIGDDDQVSSAIGMIDQHYRYRVCAWVRRQFPGISPADLADTWIVTLEDVFQAAREHRFVPNASLVSWLLTIAKARAADFTRRKASQDRAIKAVADSLRNTRVGRWWDRLTPAERNEVLRLICEFICLLPPKQRIVFEVFVDNYPDSAKLSALRDAVAKVTGKDETPTAVRRALEEGRKKIQAMLRAKGYDFGIRVEND
ncbi:MAG: sigma-70 family RNA polymerase sigma factor [Pirellulales bacterium]|nr:sigma-70 family RNA polymerase sigma factor [Pirellulales bacterium]